MSALAEASLLAGRALWFTARDLIRYNRMREMSGDGPLSQDVPKMLRQVISKESGTPLELARVVGGLPKDAARYLKAPGNVIARCAQHGLKASEAGNAE